MELIYGSTHATRRGSDHDAAVTIYTPFCPLRKVAHWLTPLPPPLDTAGISRYARNPRHIEGRPHS